MNVGNTLFQKSRTRSTSFIKIRKNKTHFFSSSKKFTFVIPLTTLFDCLAQMLWYTAGVEIADAAENNAKITTMILSTCIALVANSVAHAVNAIHKNL